MELWAFSEKASPQQQQEEQQQHEQSFGISSSSKNQCTKDTLWISHLERPT